MNKNTYRIAIDKWLLSFVLYLLPVSMLAAGATNLAQYRFEGIHLGMNQAQVTSALAQQGYREVRTPLVRGDSTTLRMALRDKAGNRNATITFVDDKVLSLKMKVNLSRKSPDKIDPVAEASRLSSALGAAVSDCNGDSNAMKCTSQWSEHDRRHKLAVNAWRNRIVYVFSSSVQAQQQVTSQAQAKPRPAEAAKAATTNAVSKPVAEPARAETTSVVSAANPVIPDWEPEEVGERAGLFANEVGDVLFPASMADALHALEAAGYTLQEKQPQRNSVNLIYARTLGDGKIRVIYSFINGEPVAVTINTVDKARMSSTKAGNVQRLEEVMSRDNGSCTDLQTETRCMYNWLDRSHTYRLEARLYSGGYFYYRLDRKLATAYLLAQEREFQQKRLALLGYFADLRGKGPGCELARNWLKRYDMEFGIRSPVGVRNERLIYKDIYRLLLDDAFTILAGKPYVQLSRAEQIDVYQKQIRPCMNSSELRRHTAYIPIVNSLAGGIPATNVELANFARQQAPGYREALAFRVKALDEIPALRAQPGEQSFAALDGLLTRQRELLAMLWPSERDQVVGQASAAKQQMAAGLLGDTLQRMAGDLSTVKKAHNMQATLDDSGTYMRLVPREKRGAYRLKYEPLLLQGVDKLLLRERDIIDDFPGSLIGLQQSRAWFQAFNRDYAVRFPKADISGTRDVYLKKRAQILKASQPSLLARIDNANSDAALDGILADYLQVGTDNRQPAYTAAMSAIEDKRVTFNRERELAKYSKRERSLMRSFKVLDVPANYTEPSAEEIRLAVMRAYAREVGGRIKDPHTVYTQATNVAMALAGVMIGIDLRYEEARKNSCKADSASGGYICSYQLRTDAAYDDETAALMTSWGGTRAMAEAPIKLLVGLSNALESKEASSRLFVLSEAGWIVREK